MTHSSHPPNAKNSTQGSKLATGFSKLRNGIYKCPHPDCQQSFAAPFNKRGILFCPHCQFSVLLSPPLPASHSHPNKATTDTEVTHSQNWLSAYKFNWRYITHPKYWLISLLILINMVWTSSFINVTHMFWLILIVAALVLGFVAVKSYLVRGRSDFTVWLTHFSRSLYAGVDHLSQMSTYPFNYIAPSGQPIALSPATQDIFSSYEPVNTCPNCQSQQLINLKTVLILDSKFFENQNLPGPKQYPRSGFDPITQTYNDSIPNNHLFCMRCHSYFLWQLLPSLLPRRLSFLGSLSAVWTKYIDFVLAVAFALVKIAALLAIYIALMWLSDFGFDTIEAILTPDLPNINLSLPLSADSLRTSIGFMLKFMVILIYMQFALFIFVTIFEWLQSIPNASKKMQLKKVEMDY